MSTVAAGISEKGQKGTPRCMNIDAGSGSVFGPVYVDVGRQLPSHVDLTLSAPLLWDLKQQLWCWGQVQEDSSFI